MLHTGRWQYLERLRADTDPVELFTTIPGIGLKLARRPQDALQVDTLADLEAAAYSGRLEAVPGVGRRRADLIRNSLAGMLGRIRSRSPEQRQKPSIALLLELDREYREKIAADQLPKIAPKRFNPTHEAWLPILHVHREPWNFTVLYSNTARAHELARVKDWAAIFATFRATMRCSERLLPRRMAPCPASALSGDAKANAPITIAYLLKLADARARWPASHLCKRN